MSKINYNNQDFLLWKANVSSYVFKIIKRLPEEINIDIKNLYKENYHPYVAAVMLVLESVEYKKNVFYHDFVIPYRNKVVIVNKTK